MTGAQALDAAIRAAVRASARGTPVEARDRPATIPAWLRQRLDRARRWRA